MGRGVDLASESCDQIDRSPVMRRPDPKCEVLDSVTSVTPIHLSDR